jgi:hypothetical protein
MLTGMRPKEIRTVFVEEFDPDRRQLVLWRHKVVEKTGLPKAVPLPTDELVEMCRARAPISWMARYLEGDLGEEVIDDTLFPRSPTTDRRYGPAP